MRYTEPIYSIASEVSSNVTDSIEKMSKDDKNSLLQFLASTGYTGVFEILSPEYKHVKDLSYLSGSDMEFIT